MDIKMAPGKYIVAVSGGVDSMALLSLLIELQDPDLDFVIAHFDHGIRPDSHLDADFVAARAAVVGLPFASARAELGAAASEATARAARYNFLYAVQDKYEARSIITAHHQDDVLENAIIQFSRGTNRKGLASLSSTIRILRPLLDYPKSQLLNYAREKQLTWREDSTNSNTRYLRNYIRQFVMPRLTQTSRLQLLEHIAVGRRINRELDLLLQQVLAELVTPTGLDRNWFREQSEPLCIELMATWLRASGLPGFDRQGLKRLVLGAKNSHSGSRLDIYGGAIIEVSRTHLALRHPER